MKVSTKAVILAAGRGTRLLPLTKHTCKALLLLNNKPIIEYALDTLSDCGIEQAVIVVGHCGDEFKKRLGNKYKNVAIEYIYNPIYEKTNSTYSLWLAKDSVKNDIIVINADTICPRIVMEEMLKTSHSIAMAVDETLTGELSEDAMKVTIVDGLIKNASKKIPPKDTHGDAIGIYRFQNDGVVVLYEELKKVVEENILDQLFTFAVQRIMDKNNVRPVNTRGLLWIEIDDHKDLKNAEKIVKDILKLDEQDRL